MRPPPSGPDSAPRQVPAASGRSGPQVSREAIVNLADQIWRERGEPSGMDEAIWLEAERRLQTSAEAQPAGGAGSPAAPNVSAQPPRPQTKISDPAEARGALQPPPGETENREPGKLRNQ